MNTEHLPDGLLWYRKQDIYIPEPCLQCRLWFERHQFGLRLLFCPLMVVFLMVDRKWLARLPGLLWFERHQVDLRLLFCPLMVVFLRADRKWADRLSARYLLH